MTPLRIGAVGYLNARPLTWALDRWPERWQVRYDVPAVCAALLQSRQVDLGLTPCIEYLFADDYRFVPGVGIGSYGPVASVALYSRGPLAEVKTLALDTSSRTSVALTRVLCQHRFGIEPRFVPQRPDLALMTGTCDAALLIGDPALDADHDALRLHKTDLGEAWTAMTGLPLVYAAWTGRAGAVDADGVRTLQEAQALGVANSAAIAAEYGGGDRARTDRARRYLSDNVRYALGPDEVAGLQLFLDFAADLGLGPKRRAVAFY
jgi:chorismate dehydratase